MAPTGVEICSCNPRDDDSGNDTMTDARPLINTRLSFKTPSTPQRGKGSRVEKVIKKQKLSMDSYLNISGLSLLSDREESFSELTTEAAQTKRKVLDKKIQSTVTRNSRFIQRFHELQEKRLQLALSPMCQEAGIQLPFLIKQVKDNAKPNGMSPQRMYRERKQMEIQQRNNRYKQKYLELQAKRFNEDTNLMDTSLPVSLPEPLLALKTLTRTCSSPASTFPSAHKYKLKSPKKLSKRKSPQLNRRSPIKQKSGKLSSSSPPRAPPRRKRQKKDSTYDVFATIQKNGDAIVDVISRDMKNSQVVMSPKIKQKVASPMNNGNSSVVTVRFAYAYVKDGKICTEF